MLQVAQIKSSASSGRGVPVGMVAVAALVVFVVALAILVPSGQTCLFMIAQAGIEASIVWLMLLSAGGWGYLLVGRLMPASSPSALRVFTACGAGLWILSTVMLITGSTVGVLRGWAWWTIISGGVVIGSIFIYRHAGSLRLGRRMGSGAILWLIVGASLGASVAGAMKPPGFMGMLWGDGFDVMMYHLQVPREFYDAGRIGGLHHNVYSFYPLHMHMLYLLTMCLRGGAYEGMYAAKGLHVAMGVMSAWAIYGSLKRSNDSAGVCGAALLVSAVLVVQMSWLAMVELGILFHTSLALLWLREWLDKPTAASVGMIGAMMGIACGMKYTSAGLVVGPILVVMIFSPGARRRIAHLSIAATVAVVMILPWLVRNYAYTQNPVFPLATEVFGKPDHWLGEHQQRWQDGHGPELKPPVPTPPNWRQDKPSQSRLAMLWGNFFASRHIGLQLVIPALVGAVLAIRKRRRWEVALGAVVAMQLAVWTLMSHQMPTRFMLPALPPMAMLGGGCFEQLANGRRRTIAWTLCLLMVGVNLWTISRIYHRDSRKLIDQSGNTLAVGPVSGHIMAELIHEQLPDDCHRMMLIGECLAFYHPPGTIYATPFDPHPIEMMIKRGMNPAQIRSELHRLGVTHIWVNWVELARLAGTYGYPRVFTEGVVNGKGPPMDKMEILEDLRARPVIVKPGLSIHELPHRR